MATRSADKTTELLEKRFQKTPKSRVFSRLADAYRKDGDINRAIELCISGIQNHPDYITGHLILGRCFLEQQNYNDAFEEFKKVCIVDRHNQIALKMLADVFVHQGMEQKAGNLYAILFKMDPFNKSLEKLTSQYKSDKITDLFEILGIQHPVEEIIWEHTSGPNDFMDEAVAYNGEISEDSIENQQVIDDISADRSIQEDISENTVAIDGDAIDQQFSMLFGENSSIESESQQLLEDNGATVQDDTILQSPSTDSFLDENADITGQDISSRIDELFSEQADSSSSSVENSLPELYIANNDSKTTDGDPFENTIAMDHNDITALTEDGQQDENSLISDSVQIESFGSLQEQGLDLIIEPSQGSEGVDTFDGKNVLSEFEETMQFDRSFLDGVMGEEKDNKSESSDQENPFINQDLIAEISDGQEISMDRSTVDAFDPSLLSDSQSSDIISEDNSLEQIDISLDSAEQTISGSGTESDIPGLESISEFNSPFSMIEDEEKSAVNEVEEAGIFQNLNDDDGTVINESQPELLSLSEELSDGADFNEDLSEETVIQKDRDFLIPDLELQEEPELDISDKPDFLSAMGENNDFYNKLQASEVTSELPQEAGKLEQMLEEIKPEEEDLLKSSSDSTEVWEQLPINKENDISDLLPEAPVPVEEAISAESTQDSGSVLTGNDDLNVFQGGLEVIDTTEDNSELDQLSVEHGEDVLTDMDVIVSDEEFNSVSGNDIVDKMDMLFPDENSESSPKALENQKVTEQIQFSDTQPQNAQTSWDSPIDDLPKELENSVSEKQISKDTITDEPSSDTIIGDSKPELIDADEEAIGSMISGQDIKDRLDQFFPSDDLISSNSALIPIDNNEVEEDLGDFYTIFGDNAENGETVDDLAGLEKVEMETPAETKNPVSFYDEWNDACSLQDQNESGSLKERVQKTEDQNKKQNIALSSSENSDQQEQNRPYTIPDHVLTPTLADIYFQQGQYDLAIQIYTRLLSRDPDNENLQQRLKQIKHAEDTGLVNEVNFSGEQMLENSPLRKRKTVVDNRPLAGVRIKKRKNNGGNRLKSK